MSAELTTSARWTTPTVRRQWWRLQGGKKTARKIKVAARKKTAAEKKAAMDLVYGVKCLHSNNCG